MQQTAARAERQSEHERLLRLKVHH
jgi:hypothetical protein